MSRNGRKTTRQAWQERTAFTMRQTGFTLKQIADFIEVDKERVRGFISRGERLSQLEE